MKSLSETGFDRRDGKIRAGPRLLEREADLLSNSQNSTSFRGHDITAAGERATADCEDDMKHGKAPTVAQKKLLKAKHLDPANWLVERDTPEQMVIIHRFGQSVRVIRKG